jgi:hypothetical protein
MIERLMARLQALNPAQQAIQLAAINQILEGSGAVVDIQMPTEAQKTRGRPKGAPNKPKTTKRDPSAFEHVEKKRKLEEKQSNQSKKQKLDRAKAEMKAFRKADQKASREEEDKALEEEEKMEEDEARNNSPPPKKRILPARNDPGKAPQTDNNQTEAPVPKKKIRPIKTADLPAKVIHPNEPHEDASAKVIHPNKPHEDASYLPSLPPIIQDSVKRILNPDSDGHCGFRAIAWCLGLSAPVSYVTRR